MLSGPMITKPGDLAAILTNLNPHDVLFIDEIHRLPIAVEEMLYPAMEDNRIDITIGEGPGARSVKIDLAPFTLVGATTRLGLISNPLQDRFGIVCKLQFYNSEELVTVVKKAAEKLQSNITEEAALVLAKAGRGTPRIVIRLLKRIRDFALVENGGEIDEALAGKSLQRLKIDERGLDELDYSYINAEEPAANSSVLLARCVTGLGPSDGEDNNALGGLYFNGIRIANGMCGSSVVQPSGATINSVVGVINLRQCGAFSTTGEGVYTCILQNSSMMDQSMRLGIYLTGRSESFFCV